MDQHIIDLLEELADLRRPAALRFRAENGGTAEIQVRIKRVEPEAAEPYLETDGGLRVSLRSLLQVNGHSVRPLA